MQLVLLSGIILMFTSAQNLESSAWELMPVGSAKLHILFKGCVFCLSKVLCQLWPSNRPLPPLLPIPPTQNPPYVFC